MNTNQLLQTAQTILALLAIVRPEATGAAALVQSAMALMRDTILPALRAAGARGDLTEDQEQQVRATFDAFAAGVQTGAAFAGDHWRPSGN